MEGYKIYVKTNEALFNELKILIDGSRSRVAAEVNYAMTSLYWDIGNHINLFVLNNTRADYGSAEFVKIKQL